MQLKSCRHLGCVAAAVHQYLQRLDELGTVAWRETEQAAQLLLRHPFGQRHVGKQPQGNQMLVCHSDAHTFALTVTVPLALPFAVTVTVPLTVPVTVPLTVPVTVPLAVTVTNGFLVTDANGERRAISGLDTLHNNQLE